MERECAAILSEMESTLAYLSIQASTNDECEVLRRNAETVVQSALAIEPYVPNGGSLVTHGRVVFDCFQALYESQQAEVLSRGHPRVLISEEQLQFYVEHGFKLCDIARLGVQGGQLNAECKSMVSLVNVDIAPYQMNSWPRLLKICCCFSQMLVKSVSGFLRAQGIASLQSKEQHLLTFCGP